VTLRKKTSASETSKPTNADTKKKKKICFVAGRPSHGYGSHEHNAGCMLLAKCLNESGLPVEAVVHKNGWPKDASFFDGADAIVMYCDGGGRQFANKNLDQINALANKGVGIGCLHYGVETVKGAPGDRFLQWTGGYFEAHWSVNPHWTAEYKKLPNHPSTIAACDFFTVPTATFRVLYCFVVIRHDTRRVVHFNVTEHPTAQWTGQQIANAFPYVEAPRFRLRDNDGIYGEEFKRRVRSIGIEEVKTAVRSPWQNPYAERVIGSIRRECLDHMIVLNEDHLRRILADYLEYNNIHRAHLGLDGYTPWGRNTEPPDNDSVRSIPFLGGLHHRYTRQAA
jgi:putative transposase